MDENKNALPAGGPAKPAQNPEPQPSLPAERLPRYRLFLALTLCLCVLLADALFWHGPTAALGAAVFGWCALSLAWMGPAVLARWPDRVVWGAVLALALTMALGSNWYFRWWNLLILLVLLPLQASGGACLPWWQPGMLWERFCLTLWGLFGNLWVVFAAALPTERRREARRTLALTLGGCAALALVAMLLPVLMSADALFAAAAEDLCQAVQIRFSAALWRIFWGLVLTPFVFGLLYSRQNPRPLRPAPAKAVSADALAFVLVLAALDSLYLLFLAVQSAGLFGGPEYLTQRGISYAEWARSGFFQMTGVTCVNLSVSLAALTLARREGRSWGALRLLSALLAGESLVLLASAAWRMTLYVSAYGLSFKRCMTYWGIGIMAMLLLAVLRKAKRPDFRFCRLAFPLLLAGWLAVNCVPIDFLVARNQVNRYLEGRSPAVSVHYLVYTLSYDVLSQLERLDGQVPVSRYEGDAGRWEAGRTLSRIVEDRRESARFQCADWRTWSLSAWLAARG